MPCTRATFASAVTLFSNSAGAIDCTGAAT
jgi:hypothetical protein